MLNDIVCQIEQDQSMAWFGYENMFICDILDSSKIDISIGMIITFLKALHPNLNNPLVVFLMMQNPKRECLDAVLRVRNTLELLFQTGFIQSHD